MRMLTETDLKRVWSIVFEILRHIVRLLRQNCTIVCQQSRIGRSLKYVQVTSATETCIQFLIKRIFGALRLLSCLIRPILHGQACLDLVGKS